MAYTSISCSDKCHQMLNILCIFTIFAFASNEGIVFCIFVLNTGILQFLSLSSCRVPAHFFINFQDACLNDRNLEKLSFCSLLMIALCLAGLWTQIFHLPVHDRPGQIMMLMIPPHTTRQSQTGRAIMWEYAENIYLGIKYFIKYLQFQGLSGTQFLAPFCLKVLSQQNINAPPDIRFESSGG